MEEYFAKDSQQLGTFQLAKAPLPQEIAESKVWRQLELQFNPQDFTASNGRNIVYLAAYSNNNFNTAAYNISSRIIYLNDFCNCLRKVSWSFAARPPFRGYPTVSSLLYALCSNPGIELLNLSVTDSKSDFSLPKAFHAALAGLCVQNLHLSILDGDLSGSGLAYKILKPFTKELSSKTKISISIEIDRLTHHAFQALLNNSSRIKEFTVLHLAEKRTLDLIVQYLQLTTRETKITIASLDLANVKMRLPRGNISLVILAAPGPLRIDITCEQELDSLRVEKAAALRIAAFHTSVRELIVTGDPTIAQAKSVRSHFRHVTTLKKTK